MTGPAALTWGHLAVALGIGLLIGAERERSKGAGPNREPAGLRTFALAALAGTLAMAVGGVGLLAAAVGGVVVLAGLAHLRRPGDGTGLTTEMALIVSPLLGALALGDTRLASAAAVMVVALLALKRETHRFVTGVLTEAEVRDGIAFGIVSLVIWPQLPDRFLGPFAALNPHTLWMVVVLVLAVGAAGHAARRMLGPRLGLPLAGLASGLASSVATIGTMGSTAARDPASLPAAAAGGALSTVATFLQLGLLMIAVDEGVFRALLPALLGGGLVAAAWGGLLTWAALRAPGVAAGKVPDKVFSLRAALVLAGTMAVALVLAAALKQWFGTAGMTAGAAVTGIADTHSAAVSVASLAAAGRLAPAAAVLPILAAVTANVGTKIVMAASAGSWPYALRIIPGLLLSTAAAWGAARLL